MIAWLCARSQGGKILLRMEDLDHPKDKPGAAEQALEDLRWLGFDWDDSFTQSARRDIYRRELERIRDRIYPCTCSRRDVLAAQSAPHEGEQLYYPGTCRGRYREFPPGACWRFRVEENTRVAFNDVFCGLFEQDVSHTLGDFPLARDVDGAGYTFACTVDDILSGVTEVIRGDDLLPVTPAQILIAKALGYTPPRYCHVPLVVGPDGRRLAKRHGDTRISAYRAAGVRPERILGFLAGSCGWASSGEEIALVDLIERFDLSSVDRHPFVVNDPLALT